MMRTIILIFCSVFMLLPQNAGAQEHGRSTPNYVEDSRSYIHNPEYQYMVDLAFKYQPKDFDFQKFRKHYSGTSWYEPVVDKLREEMLGHAYNILHNEDPNTVKESKEQYKKIVSDHLANVGIVMEAQALARQDRRFGDPEFFKWISDGLMQVVLKSGGGKTLTSAYQVYTLDEEVLLIRHFNLRLLKTDSRHSSRIYYNMHLVQELGSNEEFTLFVDVTRPFSKIERESNKVKSSVDFLRQ